MVTYRKCACGDPVCDQYTLSDQGSVGFTLDRARLYAAADDMLLALKLVRDNNRKGVSGIAARKGWFAVNAAVAKAEGKD